MMEVQNEMATERYVERISDGPGHFDFFVARRSPRHDIGKGARTQIFNAYVERTQTAMVDDPSKLGTKKVPQRGIDISLHHSLIHVTSRQPAPAIGREDLVLQLFVRE